MCPVPNVTYVSGRSRNLLSFQIRFRVWASRREAECHSASKTLMAEGTAQGRPRSALDTIIAAIAEANDCIVVTDNEKDFADLGAE